MKHTAASLRAPLEALYRKAGGIVVPQSTPYTTVVTDEDLLPEPFFEEYEEPLHLQKDELLRVHEWLRRNADSGMAEKDIERIANAGWLAIELILKDLYPSDEE